MQSVDVPVALLGYGTVGAAVHRFLTEQGDEIIYVIEGTWEYEIDGKAVRAKAGDALFVPAGVVHAARNVGNGNGAELATYVVEKGKPLVVLAK